MTMIMEGYKMPQKARTVTGMCKSNGCELGVTNSFLPVLCKVLSLKARGCLKA
jgi:hypothetical protein